MADANFETTGAFVRGTYDGSNEEGTQGLATSPPLEPAAFVEDGTPLR